MTGTTSFTEITLSQNRVPSSRTVSYFVAKPSSSEMEKLQLGPEDSILRMERIRFADDIPICFEVASIPYSLVSQYGKSEITNSFIKHLKPNLATKLAILTKQSLLFKHRNRSQNI